MNKLLNYNVMYLCYLNPTDLKDRGQVIGIRIFEIVHTVFFLFKSSVLTYSANLDFFKNTCNPGDCYGSIFFFL